MESRRCIARLFSLALALVSFMSWNLLSFDCAVQAARGATPAHSTTLAAPLSAVANGRIAFVSADDIYTINPDGSDRLRLTFSQAGQSSVSPVWSPDGTQIAFQQNEPSDPLNPLQLSEIFVMDAGGGNQRRLTPEGESDMSPAWSPDGTRIAFVRSILEGGIRRLQIFVMDADGGNPRRLTHSAFSDTFPTWSPNGMKIAFLREGDPTFHPNSGDGALSQEFAFTGL